MHEIKCSNASLNQTCNSELLAIAYANSLSTIVDAIVVLNPQGKIIYSIGAIDNLCSPNN